jgi:hypothetical protein
VPQPCGPSFRRERNRPAPPRLHATRYSCHCVDSPRAKQVFAGLAVAVQGKVRGLPSMCPAQGYCAGPALSCAIPCGPSIRWRGFVLAGHCDLNGNRPDGAVAELNLLQTRSVSWAAGAHRQLESLPFLPSLPIRLFLLSGSFPALLPARSPATHMWQCSPSR